MKWWHIALIGVGGYFIYKMMKPSTAIAATPIAASATPTSELEGLRAALQGKFQAVGSPVKGVKVAIEGTNVVFRDTANNGVVFQVPTSMTPDQIATQIDAI